MSKKAGKFALGAAVAAAAGYVTGLLTAPKSGKETREDIKDAAVKARSEAEKRLKQAHTELQSLITKGKQTAGSLSDKAKGELEAALSSAHKAKDKAKGLISAVHEGESSEKELDDAVKEAEKAIKNLKSYVTEDAKKGKK